ncbi:MAG: AarF/ABC1/UbiB kinase family protein [Armatimonadota bacterium]|nr:AarF/ABC1/UbiB kinase family protein [Armatimonadota bacterium]
MVFEKRRRHLARFIEMGRVLARHQWEHLLAQLGLSELFHLRPHGKGILPDPTDVRESLEELGPTFIKLGQLLSTRPDIIPAQYVAELEKLQDTAPTVPINKIFKVIEEEFGMAPDSIFEHFDETPLAAASLGQTHLATLKNGTKVVVKIQRPDIHRVIETDLEILQGLAHFVEQHSERMRTLGISDLVEEFAITIRQELDYTHEGRNTDRIRENLKELKFVRVPMVYWEYTTPRVLTIEQITGIKITDIHELDEHGLDRKNVAKNLAKAFMEMIFIHGFFHGDPHPGNLVVLDDCAIGLLDFGIAGRLDHRLKTAVTILLAEYIQENSAGFAEEILRIGSYPQDLNRRAFELEIDRALRQFYGAPLKEIRMGELLRKAFQISAKNHVRLPSNMFLLVKVLVNIDGIARQLYPDFDFAGEARPYVRRAMREEFSINTLANQAYKSLVLFKNFLLSLPDMAQYLLGRMVEGSFRINFKHEGLEGLMRSLERAANRLSFALVASATIVASALIVAAKIGPLWHGYPIIALIGFGISVIFGFWLMIAILRAGKL